MQSTLTLALTGMIPVLSGGQRSPARLPCSLLRSTAALLPAAIALLHPSWNLAPPALPPTTPTGRILVDGEDAQQLSTRELRNAMAVVPQEPAAFKGAPAGLGGGGCGA